MKLHEFITKMKYCTPIQHKCFDNCAIFAVKINCKLYFKICHFHIFIYCYKLAIQSNSEII